MSAAVPVVGDVHDDFSSSGALTVPDAEAVVPVVHGLISHFRHVILAQAWNRMARAGVGRGLPGRLRCGQREE